MARNRSMARSDLRSSRKLAVVRDACATDGYVSACARLEPDRGCPGGPQRRLYTHASNASLSHTVITWRINTSYSASTGSLARLDPQVYFGSLSILLTHSLSLSLRLCLARARALVFLSFVPSRPVPFRPSVPFHPVSSRLVSSPFYIARIRSSRRFRDSHVSSHEQSTTYTWPPFNGIVFFPPLFLFFRRKGRVFEGWCAARLISPRENSVNRNRNWVSNRSIKKISVERNIARTKRERDRKIFIGRKRNNKR